MTDATPITRERYVQLMRIGLDIAEQLKTISAPELSIILDTIESVPHS